jgi:6-phosphogluconolactonase
MGVDGHVASLFPHMNAVIRAGPCVIATTPIPLPPEAPFERLTLNRRALKASKAIILVVTGAAKKALIERVLDGCDDYPVSDFLRGAGPPVTIYWSE